MICYNQCINTTMKSIFMLLALFLEIVTALRIHSSESQIDDIKSLRISDWGERNLPLQYTSYLWVQKRKIAMNYLLVAQVNSPSFLYKSACEINKIFSLKAETYTSTRKKSKNWKRATRRENQTLVSSISFSVKGERKLTVDM